MAKAKIIVIGEDIINLENIDMANKRTAQKSQEDETVIHLLSIVFKSGVQASIPFETEEARNYAHTFLINELGAVRLSIPQLKKS